jgi:hypothetical protein
MKCCNFEKNKAMKYLLLTLISGLILLIGCSSEPATPNTEIELSVSGMVCEMGCGASLRKGLMAAGIEEQIDIAFDEESGLGKVIVRFNDAQFSIESILEHIESMNDGQFSAEVVRSSSIQVSQTNEASRDEKNYTPSFIDASSKGFSLPNLSELFNSILP